MATNWYPISFQKVKTNKGANIFYWIIRVFVDLFLFFCRHYKLFDTILPVLKTSLARWFEYSETFLHLIPQLLQSHLDL